MPDYGHPIRFGAFITPSHSASTGPVEIAVAAEDLGFDVVTFQDHPYQPSFYDTWTLLSFVAARTERVELAGNVINLPLRPPAVLARAVASLDLLSGGRIALGLGSGAFWDAIEAMGGPRRTPGEAVTALTEAVRIIRELWDTGSRGGVRVDGEHYRVHGAKRGPAPAHTVPIWLGAYGPRMLRLTGRVADGWLPSLSYLNEGDVARGNATIDAAAQKAGRDPREIVRLLNVGPDQTADQLTRFAVQDGVSVFIVAADDARTLEFVAREIAPAVRDSVAAARSAAGIVPGTVLRGSAARAKRMPGIAYDNVPASLASRAVEPGDPGYGRYTSGYMRGGAPGLVLRPGTVGEVRAAVRFAADHRDLPLGVFSAGHGLSGRSLNRGGLVIDVGALNRIEVLGGAGSDFPRDSSRLVRIGPGARWVDVARALAPHGLAITSGDYGGVGVGGLATAGGVGFFAREHGLTIDLIESVELVLADGSVVRADAATEPDLFWAVRGAGANFGIVTDFTFRAPHVGEVGFAQLVFDATQTARFLEKWGHAIESAPRSVSGEIILGATQADGSNVAQAFVLVDSSDPDEVVAALQPIAEIAPLLDQRVALATYDQIMSAFFRDAPQQAQGEPLAHSGLIDHLTADFAAEAAAMLNDSASYFFQIRSVGGAVADVPEDATAYAGRSANFSVAALGTTRSGLDRWWPRLLPFFSGMYLSFETGTGPEVVARAFPPKHLARLRELKRRYDPTGLFRDNFFIDPAPEADGAAPT